MLTIRAFVGSGAGNTAIESRQHEPANPAPSSGRQPAYDERDVEGATTSEPAILKRYVPRVSAEWDLDVPGELSRAIVGTLVFVDISGFTNLSERLSRKGRIGAEELTAVLNRVFGEMLDIAVARGGSLLKFGGDALLLFFDSIDHVLQATAATVEMRAALRNASSFRVDDDEAEAFGGPLLDSTRDD
ncbi:MAG: adenylate/guanylate cyclase domain-containing protein [Acidimicrobiia bacterium]